MPASAKKRITPRPPLALAAEVVETCRRMNAMGLNQGRSGNISLRIDENRFLLTPSGMAYDTLDPKELAVMDFSGRWWGPRRPSVEWRFHRDILAARPEANVVLHTHSVFATAFACQRQDMPAFHYMIAVAGGDSIRCADYATFGTQDLSDNALKALEGRKACLLANHGMICLGVSLEKALGLAVEVATLAAMYARTKVFGEPVVLEAREMKKVAELFKGYGEANGEGDGELVQVGAAWEG